MFVYDLFTHARVQEIDHILQYQMLKMFNFFGNRRLGESTALGHFAVSIFFLGK